MNEILPGIYHWTAAHPKIKVEVSSYYLADECVLIDPLVRRRRQAGATRVHRVLTMGSDPYTTGRP